MNDERPGRKYEVAWSTGPNIVGFYRGRVTVWARSPETAQERAIAKVRRESLIAGPIRIKEVKEIHD